jgi:hypothetical protein
VSAKLAELLALATDVTWSASFSDRHDSVGVYAKSALLPGCSGLSFELRTPEVWRVYPSTSSLSREEAEFWRRFSVPADRPFAGFDITMPDLAAVLPAVQLAIVVDGLRAIAARHEKSAFEDADTARSFRAVIRRYDRSWACPVRVTDGQFEDPDHSLRVERLQEHDEWRPLGCWVLRKVSRYPRRWLEPGWWATRRSADDAARHILNDTPAIYALPVEQAVPAPADRPGTGKPYPLARRLA